MGGWVGGWAGGWVGGWVSGWAGRWVGGWLAGWVGGWAGGWMGGWLAGWLGWHPDGFRNVMPIEWLIDEKTKTNHVIVECLERNAFKLRLNCVFADKKRMNYKFFKNANKM
jgi:hypothetical protein